MNKIYKVVWSKAKNMYVVVSELAKNTTKGCSTKKLLTMLLATGVMSASIYAGGVEAAAKSKVAEISGMNETYQVSASGEIAIGGGEAGGAGYTDTGDIAIGSGAKSGSNNGISTIALGRSSLAGTANNGGAVAIGDSAKATGAGAIGLGWSSNASGSYSIAQGYLSEASGGAGGGVAIGSNTIARNTNTVALGTRATSTAVGAAAVGLNSIAEGEYSLALGGSGTNARAGAGVVTAATGMTRASGAKSMAIGSGAAANAENSIAQGTGASVTSDVDNINPATGLKYSAKNSIAIGTDAKVHTTKEDSASYSIAIGNSAKVTADHAIAMGDSANASKDYALAFGAEAAASGNGSIATGIKAAASGLSSIATGKEANASGDDSVAIGAESNALGGYSLALGYRSLADGDVRDKTNKSNNNTSIGAYTWTAGSDNVALGSHSETHGGSNVVIGMSAIAMKDWAFGADNKQQESNMIYQAIGIGHGVRVVNDAAIAIGGQAHAQADEAIALGAKADSVVEGGVALGANSLALRDKDGYSYKTEKVETDESLLGLTKEKEYETRIVRDEKTYQPVKSDAPKQTPVVSEFSNVKSADLNTAEYGEVNVGNRVIGGVSAGMTDTDAVNVAQWKTTTLGVRMLDANGKTIEGQEYGVNLFDQQLSIAAPGAKLKKDEEGNTYIDLSGMVPDTDTNTYFHVNDGTNSGGNATTNLGKIGEVAGATGANSLAAGVNAQAIGRSSVAIGNWAEAYAEQSIAMGNNALAVQDATDAVVIGNNSIAFLGAEGAVIVGKDSKIQQNATKSVAVGTENDVYSIESAVVGYKNKSGNPLSDTNKLLQKDAHAFGSENTVLGNFGTALGTKNSTGNYEGSTAVGYNNEATSANASAFGSNNMANVEYTTAIGYNNQSIGGDGATSLGHDNKASGQDAVAIGANNKTTTNNTTAVGTGNKVYGQRGTAIGNENETQNFDSVAVGSKNKATGFHSVAIGYTSEALATGTIAAGLAAKATAESASAYGREAGANGEESIAIGFKAKANADDSIALGSGAESTLVNSVSLGAGSTSSEATAETIATVGSLTYGSFAGVGSKAKGSVSFGQKDAERQLKNVAAGAVSATSTDAINGSQLYATNVVLGNVANSVKANFGGNAAMDAKGNISFTDIGGTGKDTIHDAIAAARTKVKNGDNVTLSEKKLPDGSIEYTVNAKDTKLETVTTTGSNAGNISGTIKDDGKTLEIDLRNLGEMSSFNVAENGTEKKTIADDDTVDFINGTNTTASVTDQGEVTFNLDDKVKLTNAGSLTIGDTVVNNDGLTINNGPSITVDGINAGGKKITGVAAGEADNDAVNMSQLKDYAANTVSVAAGTNVKDVVKSVDEKTGKVTYTVNAKGAAVAVDSNLTLATETDDNNVTTYTVGLGNQINVGKDGKDGVDGKIGVNGADGKSGVGIDGKDGISVKGDKGEVGINGNDGISVFGKDGKDGKDGVPGTPGVTIKARDGVDGMDGARGEIGLNGKDGVTTIYTEPGRPGLDGKDGESKTRIVYEKPDGGKEEVATLNDGLKFKGDDATVITKKLNEQLEIVGGADKGNLTDKNIGVNYADGKLKVQLAKDLKDLNSVTANTFTAGDTTITTDGLTIKNGPSVTVDGINAGGKRITNVAAGETDNDAVNMSQLKDYAANTVSVAAGTNIASVDKDVDEKTGKVTYTVNAKGAAVAVDSNLTLATTTDDDNNITTYTVGLGNQINVGKDGKDGVDGKIGVNGKDGKSGVGIDGKDGISVKGDKGEVGINGNDGISVFGKDGKDGKDGVPGTPGVTIKARDGVDGMDGARGEIGLNGKDGVTTIYTEPGRPGLDGNDGKDGDTKTRIVYEKPNGDKEEVATLNDGLKYTDDFGNNTYSKLNETTSIKGGAKNEADLTEGNIGVVAKQNGQGTDLVIKLNKDINLGAEGSVKAGDTTINKDGVTTNKVSVGDINITSDGIDAGGKKITNVADGEISATSKDAVNGSQLKSLQDEMNAKVAAAKTEVKAGTNVTVTTEKPEAEDGHTTYIINAEKTTVSGDDNIKVTVGEKDDNNITNYKVSLGDELSIGGKDGKDGKIGVNGKDGVSGVGIDGKDGISVKGDKGEVGINGNDGISIKGEDGKDGSIGLSGKDGISVKGKDGKDAVSIKGIDGKDGADGFIGVNGADGKSGVAINGKDGSIGLKGADGADGTIKAVKGSDGVDGKNGADGKDRRSFNGEEVATLNDGLKYTDDFGNNTYSKLNETTSIKGGAAKEADLTEGNIGVVAKQNGQGTDLVVKLNKDINLGAEGSVKAGDTTINNGGVTTNKVTAGDTIIDKGGVSTNKVSVGDINITSEGINAGGKKITNVADGEISETSTDAINGSQLNATNQQVDNNTTNINKLGNRIDKVGAGAAALAALHPLDFDPDDKLTFAAGVGNYKGQNAGALGMFYRPDEKVMISLAGTVGNNDNMVNAGVSFSLDRTPRVTNTKTAMAREILDLREHAAKQDAQIAELIALVNSLTGREVKYGHNDILFPDIPENHWAYEYVYGLVDKGIIEGYPNGKFGGDRSMTRYEFSAMLWRALQAGVKLRDDIQAEFSQELSRFRVDRVAGEDNERGKIERIRVNGDIKDENGKVVMRRDNYGSKIEQENAEK